MAKFPKSSRKKLPPPPAPNEATNNLSQPEHAHGTYVDGRTLRATGRTTQFTTRVTEDLHRDIKVWTAQKGMRLNDFIERAFMALKKEVGN